MTARERAQEAIDHLASLARKAEREAPTRGRVRRLSREQWQKMQPEVDEPAVRKFLDFSSLLRLVPDPINHVSPMSLYECLIEAKNDVEGTSNAMPAPIRLGARRYLIACPLCPPEKNRHVVKSHKALACPKHQAARATRDYERAHIDKVRAWRKTSYERRREKCLAYQREYSKSYVRKNWEKVSEYQKNYQREYRKRKREAMLRATSQQISLKGDVQDYPLKLALI